MHVVARRTENYVNENIQSVKDALTICTSLIAIAGFGANFIAHIGSRTKLVDLVKGSNRKEDEKTLLLGHLKRYWVLQIGVLVAMAACATLAAIAYLLPVPPLHKVSQLLHENDPAVFYGSKTGLYDVVRVMPNQATLLGGTDFGADLDGAKQSFDLFANTAGLVVNSWRGKFVEALRRGVKIRIVLSDYSDKNAMHFDTFANAIGEPPEASRGACADIHRKLRAMIKQCETEQLKGTLEVRWNRKPLLYTCWVRDSSTDSAVGHLGVHVYRGKPEWPSFRVSKTCPDLVKSLADEFQAIWAAAADNPEPQIK